MPRKKDGEKRKKILDSATKVFARMGFHNARMEDVAREAGIAHGTTYLYFKGKDDLLVSIFQENLSELIEYIRAEIQKEKNAEDKFRKMVSLQIDLIESNPDLTELMLVEFPRTGKFLDTSTVDVLSDYIDMVADILREGITEGVFDNSINADIVATMIYTGIQGIATRWVLDGMSYSLRNLDREISEVFLKGIRGR